MLNSLWCSFDRNGFSFISPYFTASKAAKKYNKQFCQYINARTYKNNCANISIGTIFSGGCFSLDSFFSRKKIFVFVQAYEESFVPHAKLTKIEIPTPTPDTHYIKHSMVIEKLIVVKTSIPLNLLTKDFFPRCFVDLLC